MLGTAEEFGLQPLHAFALGCSCDYLYNSSV
jgi:hypothetical protein